MTVMASMGHWHQPVVVMYLTVTAARLDELHGGVSR